jgi:hypothetical protein
VRIFGAETAFEEYATQPNKTYECIADLLLASYICLRLFIDSEKTHLAANAVKLSLKII